MSVILKSFCYFILQVTLLLSILFLLRGHNHPGGGFIGALIASSGIIFYIITYKQLPKFLKNTHILLINIGLFLLIFSIFFPTTQSYPFLSGIWQTITFGTYSIKLGTPLLFDMGIYLVILGSLSSIITILEKSRYD